MHPHPPDLATLELLVDAAEAEAHLEMMREDLLSGKVPGGLTRPLHPWEITAGTNFAAIDDAGDRLQADLTATLNGQRRRLLEAIDADVRAQPDVATAYRRVIGLRTAGIDQVAGAAQIIEQTRQDAADLLFAHALTAAERLRQEAISQGRTVPPIADLDIATIERLDETALRLTQGPPADLLRTVADEVSVRRLTFTTPAEMADHIRGLGGSLSINPLAAHASQAIGTTEGAARAEAANKIGTATAIYASELLDRNTCGPCSLVDGHRYATEADALIDYPAGIFRQCEGGLRCRGTLVYVWEEAPPTVDEAPPAGPATLPPEPPTAPPPATPPGPSAPPPAPPRLTPASLGPTGPTEDELRAARADWERIKAQYRGHAKDVQQDALGFFEHTDARRLERPPQVGQIRNAAGRLESTGRRDSAANWDWFDNLGDAEQKRLRRTWASEAQGAGLSPDEMVQHIMDRYNLRSESEAIDIWLEQTRRYDAAGALARGKLPSAAAYGGVDVNALVDSPYNLRLLFGSDPEAAATHIAQVNAELGEEQAARLFTPLRPGFDPPWAMDETSYVNELLDLEARARTIVPTTADAEWGTSFAPGDQAILDRLNELIPRGLEDDKIPADPRDLHRMIIQLARRARLVE